MRENLSLDARRRDRIPGIEDVRGVLTRDRYARIEALHLECFFASMAGDRL